MALNVYGQFQGAVQGEIKGGVTREDVADWVEINLVENHCALGFDPEIGRVTGRRSHKPLRLVTPISKASPLFWAVCVNNENLTSIKLQWYQPNPETGTEEQFYTTEINDAQIVSVKDILPNTRDEAAMTLRPQQELLITYKHIIWTFMDGGITAEDNVDASRS